MSTNTEPTTHANREFNEYDVLWHTTSGYGGSYERTVVEAPDEEAARELLKTDAPHPAEDVRVDAVTEVEN